MGGLLPVEEWKRTKGPEGVHLGRAIRMEKKRETGDKL